MRNTHSLPDTQQKIIKQTEKGEICATSSKYQTPSHGHVMHITYLLTVPGGSSISSRKETQPVRINQLASSARTNACRVYPNDEDNDDENGLE
jgi:hypothetical protein